VSTDKQTRSSAIANRPVVSNSVKTSAPLTETAFTGKRFVMSEMMWRSLSWSKTDRVQWRGLHKIRNTWKHSKMPDLLRREKFVDSIKI